MENQPLEGFDKSFQHHRKQKHEFQCAKETGQPLPGGLDWWFGDSKPWVLSGKWDPAAKGK